MNNSCEIEYPAKGWSSRVKSWYFWKPIIGFLTGGIAGGLYFLYLGFESGSSPVTHDLLSNALFGGMIGYFFVRRPCRACC
jgi:hypothetical protein